ncbi:MAG: Acyltransferase [Conexibacter sp.]|nr:Acyltransferase [Conexibacter sp.]
MPPDDLIPLAPEDRAILALESATIAGHTCKVVRLGGERLELAALRGRVAERIEQAPLLRRRLGGTPALPGWEPDEDFAIAHHVGPAPVDEPVDRAGLRTLVARLFERHLDRARPLWRIELVPLAGGGSALVWRIHHALADGTAAMRYAQTLLWDDPPEAALSAAQRAAVHAADDARRRGHLAGYLRREFRRTHGRSPFDGPIGTRREIGFAVVPFAPLHDAAKALDGATVNDAVLTIVAGALRRWLERHHGRLGALRVKVPVSLHEEGDAAANRDSFFSLALPLDEPDPVARLRAVHAATRARKDAGDAARRDQLLHELSGVSPQLQRFVVRLERSPRRFALNVSNVPGPRAPVRVLDAPVEALHSIAEIGQHHALRVSVLSFADRLCFGFCADPGLVDDVQTMADGVEDEAAALVGARPRR